MILYNMRYRGPLEYDKFVLNTLQFHNEVADIILREFTTGNTASLANIQTTVNEMYRNVVGKNDPVPALNIVGMSERMHTMMLDLEEC